MKIQHLIAKNRQFPFYYDFKPVGQGLFATGVLYASDSEQVIYNWVYDCGSSDSHAQLDTEIDSFIRSLKGRSWIDCFIISHLDHDHISGIAEIMKRVRIERLFLPYIPLIDRIEIALAQPFVSPSSLRFAADPAGYLLELGGDNLGEVVFVIGDKGDQEISLPGDDGPQPEEFTGNEPIKPRFITINTPTDSGSISLASIGGQEKIIYITAHVSVTIAGFWEFAFFNESSSKVDSIFIKTVEDRIKKSLKSDGYFSDPDQLIIALKRLYEQRFTTGNQRNNISLVTYTGPILGERIDDSQYRCPDQDYSRLSSIKSCGGTCLHAKLDPKPSILYFGDITLGIRRLTKIVNKFGPNRWKKCAVTQIAHHGSVHSSFPNASNCFQHHYSVYSYGLHNSYKHPGKDVVYDFQKMSVTVLVNEHQGACWLGAVHILPPPISQIQSQHPEL